MNKTELNIQNNIFLKLHYLFNSKSGMLATRIAVLALIFLFVAVGDSFFSNNAHLPIDRIAIPTLAIVYFIITTKVYTNDKWSYFPHIVFFIACSSFISISIFNNNFNGIYFYFFPSVLMYFVHLGKTKKDSDIIFFYSITAAFIGAIIIIKYYLNIGTTTEQASNLWLYRLISATLCSGLLLKKVLSFKKGETTTYIAGTTYHEALFKSYIDAFIVIDKSNNEVIDCNKRVLQMFELNETESIKGLLISQVMMRYLNGETPNLEILMNGIPDNWNGEADFVTKSKHKFHAHVKSVVFQKDETVYQILSIRDITEIKVAQKEIKTTKASVEKAAKAKARFLSSMSHELRTPLNGIIGTSNLVLTEANLPENIKRHINVLRYSSEHMLGIINDILDFSKIDAGKLELKKQPFSIQACLDNIIASFDSQFKQKNLKLITNFHPQLYKVHVSSDKIKLSQIISNLLSNALKFTQVGKVELNVSITKSNSRKVSVFIEVKDTGIGIPEDRKLEIFQGFVQVHGEQLKRDFGGTGLGLTISEKLVSMFGGKLEVESEVGKGSSFHFTISLPIAEIMVTPEDTSSTLKINESIKGVRILIVEDNEINASILKSFLLKWNIIIKEATHGIHALELLKYHKFDLILMDLEMPEMDGYTTIKKIREAGNDVPVIAFTAALLENMEISLSESGFNDYLLKPFRPAELKKKIETHAKRQIDYA